MRSIDTIASPEHERRALGAILQHPHLAAEALNGLQARCFTCGDRRQVFGVVCDLVAEGKLPDALTVQHIIQAERLQVGTDEWLACLDHGYTAHRLLQDAALLLQLADRRALIADLDRLRAEAVDPERLPSDVIAEAQSRVMQLGGAGGKDQGPVSIADAMDGYIEATERRLQNPGQLMGAPTGFRQLDDMLCGLIPGDLIIVAGRPSMGKTTFGLNLAENLAWRHPERGTALIFSLEMSTDLLINRMVCSLGQIDSQNMRFGRLGRDEQDRYYDVTGQLRSRPIAFDDKAALDIGSLVARAHRQRAKGPLSLIVVDYIQRMKFPGHNRNEEVGAACNGLKTLAMELQVPVVALSQLNRGVEGRAEKRPTMGDLRDSGNIEQDADVILFPYRDEFYDKDSPDKGAAEIIIAKQRNGPCETVRVGWEGRFNRFTEHAPTPVFRPAAARPSATGRL